MWLMFKRHVLKKEEENWLLGCASFRIGLRMALKFKLDI